MQRFLLIFTGIAVFFAEGVSAQTANPSTSPQPLNIITVHAGQCECGKSIGSFDALYQNRTINIGFGFESTLVFKEDSLFRNSYQWICPSHDNIMADCLLTEAEVTVAGTWESTNLFVAKVIHLPKMCLEGIRAVQALVEARKKGLPLGIVLAQQQHALAISGMPAAWATGISRVLGYVSGQLYQDGSYTGVPVKKEFQKENCPKALSGLEKIGFVE